MSYTASTLHNSTMSLPDPATCLLTTHLRKCEVLVHHVAPEVGVAHAQHGRAVKHVRRADLARAGRSCTDCRVRPTLRGGCVT
eukprot:scaffold43932_cov69-Phaeocystis_antarctica.AAC.3